jgi:serine/threonine-protein kinase
VAIAAHIADALEHAHAAGLIHRDIKPHNVIVSDEDRVKVTDFGIARAIGESTLTATGSVLGTAQYISPEQASGTQVGPASDVYSLGIVLYEMLTGAVPFTGDSALAIAMRHVNDPVPSPSALNPAIPRELDLVVQRATAKAPGDRFSTAGEMAASLRAVGVGDTDEIDAPTVVATAGTTQEMHLGETWPFPGHPTRWNVQRLGRVVIAAFALLFLLALAALAYRLTAGSDDPPSPERDRNQAPVDSPPAEEDPEEAEGFVLENYKGVFYEEVVAVLEAEGIMVDTDPVETEAFAEGQVVDQSPDPGTQVFEGDTVTLLVSTGAPSEEDDEDGEEGSDKAPKEPPGQAKKDKDKDEGDD